MLFLGAGNRPAIALLPQSHSRCSISYGSWGLQIRQRQQLPEAFCNFAVLAVLAHGQPKVRGSGSDASICMSTCLPNAHLWLRISTWTRQESLFIRFPIITCPAIHPMCRRVRGFQQGPSVLAAGGRLATCMRFGKERRTWSS